MGAMKIVFAAITIFVEEVLGHGMVLDPPSRSSMWRYDFAVEPNYDDMGLNCGGFYAQHSLNGGNCGICGDNFADPIPRNNEDGGLYGRGIVTKTYFAGSQIPVVVELTQEHKGYFEFGLCDLSQGPESEDCFHQIYLVGGGNYVVPGRGDGRYVNHTLTLQLPEGVKCERCVMRWHYITGNNQGICIDGTEKMGCGPQEEFQNCIDIAIIEDYVNSP